jgi:ATP diphosphatase
MIADRNIDMLLDIMARLRTPEIGCAWDLAQTFQTIAPFAVEEAYEVVDAIERNDLLDLRDELGDLLLQVVFHARMAQERGVFDFGDVVTAICAKLVRRHPHVFGDARDLSPDEVKTLWDAIKRQEKAARAAERGVGSEPAPHSALDKVPAGLPPLSRALRLQTDAAKVGFDWPELAPVIDKISEETAEVEDAIRRSASALEKTEEIGDLLFAAVNLARHAGVDPDEAMRSANAKFARRFRAVEAGLAAEGRTPQQSTLAEMDAHWDAVKRAERQVEP